jgi:hypothetical protein
VRRKYDKAPTLSSCRPKGSKKSDTALSSTLLSILIHSLIHRLSPLFFLEKISNARFSLASQEVRDVVVPRTVFGGERPPHPPTIRGRGAEVATAPPLLHSPTLPVLAAVTRGSACAWLLWQRTRRSSQRPDSGLGTMATRRAVGF